MSAPNWIWIDPGAMEIVLKRHDPSYDILYVRADVSEAALSDARKVVAALLEIRSVWTDPHNDETVKRARDFLRPSGGAA